MSLGGGGLRSLGIGWGVWGCVEGFEGVLRGLRVGREFGDGLGGLGVGREFGDGLGGLGVGREFGDGLGGLGVS